MELEQVQLNKQTVTRLYQECINGNKLDLLPELVASDYVGVHGESGPAGFGTTLVGIQRGIPDIHFELEDLVAERDEVAVRWSWSGHHQGALGGIPPTHRRITNAGIAIYKLRDGKITRAWLQMDRLGVLQQVGAVPAELGKPPAPQQTRP